MISFKPFIFKLYLFIVYAAIQQLGGQAGKNKKVNIPARPYLKFSEDDYNEIFSKTINYFS